MVVLGSNRSANQHISDHAWPFFLNWLVPIGIWLIQPRINRLYTRHSTPADEVAQSTA